MIEATASKHKPGMTSEGHGQLKEIAHEHAEDGGHIITHRHEDGSESRHVFGKAEGKKALKHMAKRMGVSVGTQADAGTKPDEGEEDETKE